MPSESVKYGTFDLPVVALEPPFGGSSAYNAGFGGEKLTIGLHTNDVPVQTSSSASFFDCTVGTGGDYATVTLAYAAGKRNALLISDVTETATSGGFSGMTVVGNRASRRTWTMAGGYNYFFGNAENVIFAIPSATNNTLSGNFTNCRLNLKAADGNGFSGTAIKCDVVISGSGYTLGTPRIKFSFCDIDIGSGCYIIGALIESCKVYGSGSLGENNHVSSSECSCNYVKYDSGNITDISNNSLFSSCYILENDGASTASGISCSACRLVVDRLLDYSTYSSCTSENNITGTVTGSCMTGCVTGPGTRTINVTGTNCIFVGNKTGGLTVGGTGNVVANNI
jgi:hypothetical protein